MAPAAESPPHRSDKARWPAHFAGSSENQFHRPIGAREAAAQLSEQTMRCVAEVFAHSAHSARPHQAQTATASVWWAKHFMAFDGRGKLHQAAPEMQTGIFLSSNNEKNRQLKTSRNAINILFSTGTGINSALATGCGFCIMKNKLLLVIPAALALAFTTDALAADGKAAMPTIHQMPRRRRQRPVEDGPESRCPRLHRSKVQASFTNAEGVKASRKLKKDDETLMKPYRPVR